MRLCVGTVFLLAAWAGSASGQTVDCAAIENPVKRQLCTDLVKEQQASPGVAVDHAKAGLWNVTTDRSKIDDSPSVFLHLSVKEGVKIRYDEVRPVLVLRCLENRTSFILQFDPAFMADIQGYGDVTLRIDDTPAFEQSMNESTDNRALGLWSGGQAIPMIKRLFGGKTLLVRATPFNESPITVEFPIEGVEEAVKPLRAACAW